MQNVDLKRGVPTSNFSSALSTFLQTKYHRSPEEFAVDLRELEDARMGAVNISCSSDCIPKLQRYYGQLKNVASKFPCDGDQIMVTFSWHNFTGKETKPISSYDINYEIGSVLMNLGLLNAKLGAVEGRGSPEKLRKACNYYLVAAGIFQHIIDNYVRKLVLPPSADLREPALQALHQLMLAQAQECFVLKGHMDKSIRDAMLSKLASSTALMYQTAADLAVHEKNLFGAGWINHCQAKSQYFLAFANNKKAAEMLAETQYGKELCRLEMAMSFIKDAKAILDSALKAKEKIVPEVVADVTSLMVSLTRDLERARKDNDIIYHDPVPSKEAIGDLGAAVVANAIAFVEPSADTVGGPVFESLPTFALQQNITGFLLKRDEIVAGLRELVQAGAGKLDEALARMNLPAALDSQGADALAAQQLPQSLFDRSNEIRMEGGAESLYNAKLTVEMLRTDGLASLRSTKALLDEEAREDASGRSMYGSKWKRAASDALNGTFKSRLRDLENAIGAATQTDQQIFASFDQQIPAISKLGKLVVDPSEVLGFGDQTKQDAARETLKDLVLVSDTLKFRLANLDEAITKVSAELDTSFLTEGQLHEPHKSDEAAVQLARFDWIRTELATLNIEIDEHLVRLSTAFEAFSDMSEFQAKMLNRTQLVHELEGAYTNFTTLTGHFNQGIDFYSKCNESLQVVESEVRDWRESRRIEQQDLLRSIEQQAAPPAFQPPPPPLQQQQQPYQPQPGMWTPNMPVQYQQQPPYQQPPYQQPYQQQPYQQQPPYGGFQAPPQQQQQPPQQQPPYHQHQYQQYPGNFYPGQHQPPY